MANDLHRIQSSLAFVRGALNTRNSGLGARATGNFADVLQRIVSELEALRARIAKLEGKAAR